jgi:hypothetical protein
MDVAVIPYHRQVLAFLWATALMLGFGSLLAAQPHMILFSMLATGILMPFTISVGKPSRNERIVRSGVYRVAWIVTLVAALCGVAFGLVPGAIDTSKVMAVYFGVVAIVSYTALVARGPSAAMVATMISLVLWIPFVFITLMGCGCGSRDEAEYVPHWTGEASIAALTLVIFFVMVSLIATLVAFVPRDDQLPDARALRRSTK